MTTDCTPSQPCNGSQVRCVRYLDQSRCFPNRATNCSLALIQGSTNSSSILPAAIYPGVALPVASLSTRFARRSVNNYRLGTRHPDQVYSLISNMQFVRRHILENNRILVSLNNCCRDARQTFLSHSLDELLSFSRSLMVAVGHRPFFQDVGTEGTYRLE